MKRSWVLAGVAVTAAFVSPCAAAPLEAYGRLPFIESVAISPDGKMLALAVTNGEQRKIVLQQVQPWRLTGGLNAGAQKIRRLQWAGPNHLIITMSVATTIADVLGPKSEYATATDFNIAKKTQRPLISGVDHSLNVVYGDADIRFIKTKPVAFVQGVHFQEGAGQVALFKVDLESDTTSIASPGFPNTRGYVVGADGKPLAESEYDAPRGKWVLKLWRGSWRQVQSTHAQIETPSLLGLGRDGASVLVGFFDDNRKTLRELSPDRAAWSEPLPLSDSGDLIWDPATSRLIGEHRLLGDKETYRFLDPGYQRIWNAVAAAYPGERVSLVSVADDRKRLVVRVDSPTDGPAFALVDLDTKKGSWIGNEYEQVKPKDIAPVRPIAFKAKDGLQLTGYLTLPRGKDPRKLPLVVFPHGGPAARDEPGFDWWAQAMASRGYAVLQVNYRGSDGLGWDFLSAGFGQWGRKMQTDLSDGVRWLAGDGVIDPARVCIVGGSYGGYAALAGPTLDLGVYRCAASVAGPAALGRFIDWGKSREGRQGVAGQRYWTRFMGAMSTLDEISPASHADKVTIPILLVHGKDDTVVPYQQSQIMADALTKAGKPFEFVTLKAEDHWLSRGATRLQMLQAVVAFLEKYNPP